MKRLLSTLSCLLLLTSFDVYAESTVDLYGGIANTDKANVTITRYYFIGTPDTFTDSINGSSGVLGVRFVHWLDEDDIRSLRQKNQDNDMQDYRFVGFSADLLGFKANGDNTDALTAAITLNVLFRYPHKTWQPYMGIGILFHTTKIDVSGESELGESTSGSDSGLGMDFQAGLRVSLSSRYALFTEYRYTFINFEQDTDTMFFGGDFLSTELQTHHYLVGISWSL